MRSQHYRTLLFLEYIVKSDYGYSNFSIPVIKQQESLIKKLQLYFW